MFEVNIAQLRIKLELDRQGLLKEDEEELVLLIAQFDSIIHQTEIEVSLHVLPFFEETQENRGGVSRSR